MIKKVSIIVLVVFFTQISISCLFRCPEPEKFEIIYTGVEVMPYNTLGFNPKPFQDSVPKLAFGLTVTVSFKEDNKIACSISNGFYGFSSLKALSCIEDEYIYSDPIQGLEIFTIEVGSEERRNVSKSFRIYGYDSSEPIHLDEFFATREDWHDGFQIELVDGALIPNSTIFAVDVLLESGTILSNHSEEINFY